MANVVDNDNQNKPEWWIGFEPIRRCLDFSGRSRRAEFWIYTLSYSAINQLTRLIPDEIYYASPVGTIILIIDLFLILCWVSVFVRRLHDTNRTGWWAIYILLIFSMRIAGYYLPEQGVYLEKTVLLFIGVCSIAISILLFLWLIRKGTNGPNRYGKAPLR